MGKDKGKATIHLKHLYSFVPEKCTVLFSPVLFIPVRKHLGKNSISTIFKMLVSLLPNRWPTCHHIEPK